MPIVPTTNPDVLDKQGVHLFHFGLSSCSQRVRFALEEKGVTWESHPVDLHKMEHVSDWYQAIHPGGYVPALVHDGRLITESTDIIAYIDETFPGPSLQPESASDRENMQQWLDIADTNQWCLKHLTYELIFKALGHFSKQEEVDYYLAHQKNPELVQFTKDFVAGFSQELIAQKLTQAHEFLARLNTDLADKEYLLGETFSLADIANIVNVHRYRLCKLDVEQYPSLLRWYDLVAVRPAFQRGIVDWQPE